MAKEYQTALYHINGHFEVIEVREIIRGERDMVVIKRPRITKLVTVPVHNLYIDYEGHREHFDPNKNYALAVPKADGADSGEDAGESTGDGEDDDENDAQ